MIESAKIRKVEEETREGKSSTHLSLNRRLPGGLW